MRGIDLFELKLKQTNRFREWRTSAMDCIPMGIDDWFNLYTISFALVFVECFSLPRIASPKTNCSRNRSTEAAMCVYVWWLLMKRCAMIQMPMVDVWLWRRKWLYQMGKLPQQKYAAVSAFCSIPCNSDISIGDCHLGFVHLFISLANQSPSFSFTLSIGASDSS